MPINIIEIWRYFLEQLNKGIDYELVTDLISEDDLAFIGDSIVADGARIWWPWPWPHLLLVY